MNNETYYRLIETTMEKVQTIAGSLNHPFHYKIKDMGCPHEQPSPLERGQNAIYMFIKPNESGRYEFLKIGKVNQKSSARFVSQHYGFSARSTLAKSLCNDPYYQGKGLNEDNIKDWMLNNLIRVNIYFEVDECDDFLLSFIESYLHLKFRPKYEGKNKG